MKKLFTAMSHADAVSPIDLFSDSEGAIAMNYNPVRHEARKHCEIADHYAREQVERKYITISHVPSDKMLADVLTKPHRPEIFERFISQLMADAPLQP